MALSQVISQLGLMANRPKFELAFNQLQNTLLGRLNEKIQAMEDADKAESGNDAFLQIGLKRVQAEMPIVRDYAQSAVTGGKLASAILKDLDELDVLAASGDAENYNLLRDKIEAQLDRVPPPTAPAIGLYYDDGIHDLQKRGTAISDFVDQATATTEIGAFRSRALTLSESMTTRQVHATYLLDQAESKLSSLQIQIETTKIAQKAEKIDAINKEKEKTGQLLQMLSLAFEVDMDRQEKLAAQLQQTNRPAPGSVLNLFT